ncbi:MAG: hypothetical protein K2Y22_15115 [Candidatus Obscuribacterales bacterium]|nr:hypothetical protein [Candidatus Obscuribacterales bacterium]
MNSKLVSTMYGESVPCWINKSKIHSDLLHLYEKPSILTYAYELFPVHITFDESSGSLDETSLRAIRELAIFEKYHRGMETWTGNGWTGETFALRGVVDRASLQYISNIPGVKAIFKIIEVDIEDLNTQHWQ